MLQVWRIWPCGEVLHGEEEVSVLKRVQHQVADLHLDRVSGIIVLRLIAWCVCPLPPWAHFVHLWSRLRPCEDGSECAIKGWPFMTPPTEKEIQKYWEYRRAHGMS